MQSLMDGGMQRSDALNKVAEERGVSLSTIRAAASNTTRTGTRTTVRRKPQTPEEMIQEAKAMLQSALDGLEKEVEQAKERADEAAAEYKSLKESMTERKKSLKQKIAALDA